MKTPEVFTLYSPVLILGNLCRHTTSIGLYGYVSKTPGSKDGSDYWVEAFRDHEGEPSEKSKDWPNFRTTTFYSAKPSDLRPLTGKARLERVARLVKHKQKEKAKEKSDPKWNALMASLLTPEAVNRRQTEEQAMATETARIGRVFTLPGVVKRGDKSTYPAYKSPEVNAVAEELRGYANKGPKECTLTERARWKQCLETIECVSFWSNREECRAVVREFDLDPMADEHNGALYRHKIGESVWAKDGELRATVIRLWNKGAQILHIQDGQDPETCASDEKQAKGFLISFGFRRKLPV